MKMQNDKRVVLFGGSGAIGTQVARMLWERQPEGSQEELCVVLRKRLDGLGDCAKQLVREDIADVEGQLSGYSVGVICLGTTLRQAGSKEAFFKIDVELVERVARSLKHEGVRELHVISSMGASQDARSFYLRCKAEMEQRVRELSFETLQIYRPSLLYGAARTDFRLAETLSAPVLQFASRLFPPLKKWAPLHVNQVAAFLVSQIGRGEAGVHIHEALAIRGEDHKAP